MLLILIVIMYTYVCLCVDEYEYPWGPEEGIRSGGAEIAGFCEQLTIGVGSHTDALPEQRVPSHEATSLAPYIQ